MRSLVALCLLLTGAVTPLAAQETTGRAWERWTRAALFRGYLDFGYVQSDERSANGFGNGQFTGRFSFRPADRWRFLGELALEGNSTGVELALDRLLLEYHASDAFRLSIGRHLTPLGWWNPNVTRGGWLRTTIVRPEMLNRQRGFLPLYALGAMARGIIATDAADLGYVAGVANGRGGLPGTVGTAGDPNRNRAWMVGMNLRPGPTEDLHVGALLYNDHVTLDAGSTEADERILSAHAAWLPGPVEVIGEIARVDHELPGPGGGPAVGYTSRSFFIQAAFRLPGGAHPVKPYGRLGRINLEDGDPVFATQGDYSGYTVGIRWDLSEIGAVKAEYRNERFGTLDRAGTLAIQLSARMGAPENATVLAAAPAGAAEADADGDPPSSAADGRDERPANAVSSDSPVGVTDETAPGNVRPRPVAIVAHPGTPVDGLSLPELRRIFRGERQYWSGNRRIILLVRSPLPMERQIVLAQIYRMNEEEFKRLWLSKVFRNTAVSGPKMVENVSTALELVAALPGAISFVSASRLGPDSSLEIIPIEGKLPGDPGYPLQ